MAPGRNGLGTKERRIAPADTAQRALIHEFREIKRRHREALKKTAARVVLGPSVMRVYRKGTTDALRPVLAEVPIDELGRVRDQKHFSAWFDSQVHRITGVIARRNRNNPRIHPGLKWGHATKIMALFVRRLVLTSQYFPYRRARRLSFFLHCPIDGVVMLRLKKLGIRLRFKKIKDIDRRAKFYQVQKMLGRASAQCGVPRVWFDDNWGDRQEMPSVRRSPTAGAR